MKTLRTILTALVLICTATSLQAQSLEDIFESNWEGGSQSLSTLTDDDYLIAQIQMYNVDYNSSYDTFTASMMTVYVFGSETYSCETKVKGSYISGSNRVIIKHDRTVDYDYLPDGLYWTHPTINLIMYNDTDCDGYFGMVGQSADQSEEDEYFALSNCPYY